MIVCALSTMAVVVKMMGGFALFHQGQAVKFPGGKARLLLVYLLLHPETPHDRSRLASLFWPDSSESQARTNLRRELNTLKRRLPEFPSILNVTTDALSLCPEAPITVELDGDQVLLPGEDEPWLDEIRRRRAQDRAEQLENEVRKALDGGDPAAALESLQSLLDLDPLREDLHREKMRLLALRGDRAGALKAYESCLELLREELGVDPGAPTRMLHERLLMEEQTERPSDLPLYGRETEWAQLQAWLESALVENWAPLLLLSGEPGIGKSHLLNQLRQSLTSGLGGRCYEAEQDLPFALWRDAIPRFAEFLHTGPEPTSRAALFDRLVRHLVADHPSPLVLIMDDIQWLDEASAALLHFTYRSAGLPVVCAARAAELEENPHAQRLLRSLARDNKLRRLKLGPLSASAISDLAPGADPSRCGGNPLLALELARAGDSSAANLTELLESRLTVLSSRASELLAWASVLGSSFSPLRLQEVCGRSLPEMLPALEELERHNLLRPIADGYDFAHDVMRETVYGRLSVPRRQLLHLQIAQSLEGTIESGEIARHAELGGDATLAARASLAGATEYLGVLAFHEAYQLAEKGLFRARQLPSAWELELALFGVMLSAGVPLEKEAERRPELEQLIHKLSRQPELQSRAKSLLATWDFDRQRLDAVQERFLDSERLARGSSPKAGAHLLAHAAACLAAVGREFERVRALVEEAERLAERCPNLEVVEVTLARGFLARFDGQLEEAESLLLHCLELARERESLLRECVALSQLAMLYLEQERYQDTRIYAHSLLELAPRLGPGSEGPAARTFLALSHRDAEGTQEGLEQIRQVDNRRLLAYCLRQAARGALDPTVCLEEAYQVACSPEDSIEMALCGAALCHLYLDRGDRDRARPIFTRLRELREPALSQEARQARKELGRRWAR